MPRNLYMLCSYPVGLRTSESYYWLPNASVWISLPEDVFFPKPLGWQCSENNLFTCPQQPPYQWLTGVGILTPQLPSSLDDITLKQYFTQFSRVCSQDSAHLSRSEAGLWAAFCSLLSLPHFLRNASCISHRKCLHVNRCLGWVSGKTLRHVQRLLTLCGCCSLSFWGGAWFFRFSPGLEVLATESHWLTLKASEFGGAGVGKNLLTEEHLGQIRVF